MKKENISKRISVYLIAGLLAVFGIAFFLTPKTEFSESENRSLAKWPEFSIANLTSGRYTEGVKDYLSDHFPKRDELLKLINSTERMSGRREINGVYLCEDRLINSYEEPKNVEKDINQFGKLADNVENTRVSLMLVPTATSIYWDMLPEGSPDYEAADLQRRDTVIKETKPATTELDTMIRISSAMPDKVNHIQADAELLNAAYNGNENLYYRTDHHWTTYGAYTGYTAICKSLGLDATPIEEFDQTVVTTDFYGSIYSKLNDDYVKPDEIVSYSYPGWDLRVEYADSGLVTDTPYDPEYLNKRDKYSYFLSNQHGFITITNEAVAEDAGAMALVKDSYANCLVPFLLNHYRTLYIFDTRYHKGGVSKFVNSHEDVKEVLILYNMGTLDKDSGIGGIY
ncbi:MAG: hypothetical protein J6X66_09580 [Lachnospiraceae bacterium]|nr:hypothetical protein [Lachnospiraceae bacterium]